jgi:hypothetical protein
MFYLILQDSPYVKTWNMFDEIRKGIGDGWGFGTGYLNGTGWGDGYGYGDGNGNGRININKIESRDVICLFDNFKSLLFTFKTIL